MFGAYPSYRIVTGSTDRDDIDMGAWLLLNVDFNVHFIIYRTNIVDLASEPSVTVRYYELAWPVNVYISER